MKKNAVIMNAPTVCRCASSSPAGTSCRSGQRAQSAVEQVEQPRAPDQRRDEREQREVGQALQRVVLLHRGLAEGVRHLLEDPHRVVEDHRRHVLHRRDVLPPLAGGELPEDREGPDHQQGPRREGVNIDCILEAHQRVAAVDLEAGDHHDDDQQRLRPVPEALIALVDVDAVRAHFQCPLRRVRMRAMPWIEPAPIAPMIASPPSRSTQPLRSRPGM